MNITRQLFITTALFAAASAACAQATITHDKALAGSVTPGDSAGYPITISQPGSYKLMGNLVVPDGVNGIEINAPNVTLDLNGFSVTGPTLCTGMAAVNVVCALNVSTIGIKSNQLATTVRNGTVSGFNSGVSLGSDGTLGSYRLEDVIATRNALWGIVFHGGTGVRLQGSYNGVVGIGAREAMLIDSLAISNKYKGIELSNSSARGVRVMDTPYGVASAYGKASIESSFIQASTAPFSGGITSLGGNLCNGSAC